MNALYDVIVDVWMEVLRLPAAAISPDSDFFALGGNSLAVLAMVERLKKRLEREIPVLDVIEHSTARGLADHLSQSATASLDEGDV